MTFKIEIKIVNRTIRFEIRMLLFVQFKIRSIRLKREEVTNKCFRICNTKEGFW